jgi:hypothetical protein
MVDTPMPRPKKRPDTQEQANQTPDAQTEAEANGGVRVNKMEQVRKALRRLGNDAKPKRIQGYLRKRFLLEMSTDMISTYKGSILKKQAGEGREAQPEAVVEATTTTETASGGISVEELRAVKEVVDRIGADKVKQLVDVLYQ